MSETRPLILYVDDDPDFREVMRHMLRETDVDLALAASAEEAAAMCRQRLPDFVIVDLMMEEVDSGIAFVKELRLMGSQAPIYMLSSVGESMSLTADHRALGLAGIFQKPLDRETLRAVLKARVGR